MLHARSERHLCPRAAVISVSGAAAQITRSCSRTSSNADKSSRGTSLSGYTIIPLMHMWTEFRDIPHVLLMCSSILHVSTYICHAVCTVLSEALLYANENNPATCVESGKSVL